MFKCLFSISEKGKSPAFAELLLGTYLSVNEALPKASLPGPLLTLF